MCQTAKGMVRGSMYIYRLYWTNNSAMIFLRWTDLLQSCAIHVPLAFYGNGRANEDRVDTTIQGGCPTE